MILNSVRMRNRNEEANVRFADDAVLMFERRGDLEEVMEVLPNVRYVLTTPEPSGRWTGRHAKVSGSSNPKYDDYENDNN